MPSRQRLCDRAFLILDAELKRLCGSAPLEQVRRSLVLKRLERLRQQQGQPADYGELKAAVEDIFPDFDERVLKRAARLNRPSQWGRAGQWVVGTALGLGAVAGGLWLVNLPYPMIRWPVAKIAPLLLLPSFMQMDHNYRQAIIDVEQADQLVNSATSAADFELGAAKAEQAQTHLDRLPVWFLGYYPQRYCSWFSCGWQFTLDEFEAARALIGRMDAQIFQQQNALTLLEEGTLAVETAKRRYETVPTLAEKAAILATWQEGMDKLAEIPPETLAGKTAQTRLQAFQRDYAAQVGSSSDISQSSTVVQAAKNYAALAAQSGQNPPHSAATWGRAAKLWESAIANLDQVPTNSPGYIEAQQLRGEYQNNLGIVQERQADEQQATEDFRDLQRRVNQIIGTNSSSSPDQQRAVLQDVANQLAAIPAGTTVSQAAVELLQDVRARQQRLNQS